MSRDRRGGLRCGPVDLVVHLGRVVLEVALDGWLCQDCRSVNSPSAANCYRCWTPRRFAEAPDPATLPPGVTPEQAHAERQRQLRPTLADARSSRRRSWIVLACITGTVAFNAMSLAFMGAKGGSLGIALGVLSGEWTALGSLLAISIVGGVLALVSAIAWFVWFDRVLANVPPMTGKWPEISRVMAVVWWLVPVVGQFKGTFIVGHVYGLMAVAGSPGLWLLGLWGATWIGGTTAPNVVGFVVGWLPLPLEESIHLKDLVSNLGQISYIASGFFAAALILALEHARDVRASGQADATDAEHEVSLPDRLAGRTPGTRTSLGGSTPSQGWSGAPGTPASPGSQGWSGAPGAPASPGTLGGPVPWPVPSTDWADGPTAWPAGTAESMGPQQESAPAWPAPQPLHAFTSAKPVTNPEPVTNPDPFEPPAAVTRRVRERAPVPFEPILLMGALVLAGVVAGVTMAGMVDPFGALGRSTGQGATSTPTADPSPSMTGAMLATPDPSPDAGTSPNPAPSTAVGSPIVGPTATPVVAPPASATPVVAPPASATPVVAPPASATPAPTRVPADLVARRLVRIVTNERYRGLADIDATYADASGDTTWSIRLGRMGEREWRLQEVRRPGSEPEILERASLVSTVWERDERSDWVRRQKTDADRATPPLFDLTDAGQLSFRGLTEEGGVSLYRFGWDAGDDRIQQFIRVLGAARGMTLESGELLATERGVPVRLDVSLTGDASEAAVVPSLRMSVTYSEVGSDIEVRSPRVGPPLVVRH